MDAIKGSRMRGCTIEAWRWTLQNSSFEGSLVVIYFIYNNDIWYDGCRLLQTAERSNTDIYLYQQSVECRMYVMVCALLDMRHVDNSSGCAWACTVLHIVCANAEHCRGDTSRTARWHANHCSLGIGGYCGFMEEISKNFSWSRAYEQRSNKLLLFMRNFCRNSFNSWHWNLPCHRFKLQLTY